MNVKKSPIPIRTKLMPTFYPEFSCMMDQCQENCCDCNWNIIFSKKDYLKVKRASENSLIEEQIKQAMRRLPEQRRTTEHYAEFVTHGIKCPLHNENGLCALQLECGAETLPLVCRTFPRKDIYTAMAKEYSLSTACEAVVTKLWNLPGGIEFIEEPLEREQWRYATSTQENLLFPTLRAACIDILQCRSYSIPERLILLGMVLEVLQKTGLENITLEGWQQQIKTLLNGPKLDLQLGSSVNEIALKNYLDTVKRSLIHIPYFRKLTFLLNATVSVSKNGASAVSLDKLAYYTQLNQQFEKIFKDISYFWENILVNTWFYLGYPELNTPDTLWKSYINFCQIYNFFRHTAVLECGDRPTPEKLIHAIVMASRETIHNSQRQSALRDHFFQHDSATLAHMAILVQN